MSSVNVIREIEVQRFQIQLTNTGIIVIREYPFYRKKKVEINEGFEKKVIEIEIPVWKYLTNPQHSLVFHVNDFIKNTIQLPKLPKKVLNFIFNFVEFYKHKYFNS